MLSNQLKQFRINHGISQIGLARKLEVSLNTYIFWERGVNNPNKENQEKIEKLFREITKEVR